MILRRKGSYTAATSHRWPARSGSPDRFRVLMTSQCFEPGFRGGGPIRSVAHVVDTISPDVELILVTNDRDLGARDPYDGISGRWIARGQAWVHYLAARRMGSWSRLVLDLRSTRFDLMYLNSLFNPLFSVAPIIAARLRIIRVQSILIAPRGELHPGALAIKSRRKRLLLTLCRALIRSMRIEWHASTDTEAAQIRTVFPGAECTVVAAGTLLPKDALMPDARDGNLRAVFISRISPMKNLDLALSALSLVSAPVSFDIYGPIEDAAYWQACQRIIATMPDIVTVTYCGELAQRDVRITFGQYDLFLFPTQGESFGHAIAEALSASCAVLTSGETPWTNVLRHGGGTVVRQLDEANVAEALDRFALMSSVERHSLKNGVAHAYHQWRTQMTNTNVIAAWRLKAERRPPTPLSAPRCPAGSEDTATASVGAVSSYRA